MTGPTTTSTPTGSARPRISGFSPKRAAGSAYGAVADAARAQLSSKRKRARLRRLGLYVFTLAGLAFVLSRVDWQRVQEKMFNPEIAREQFPEIATEATKSTLIFTVYGFSGALVIGLLIALMRLSSIRPYRWFAILYIDVFRGLPALLTIVFIGFAMPIALRVRVPGPEHATGGLALAIVFGAYIAEILRAGIEAVPKGQMEAARSLGMSQGRAMGTIVVPQAFRMVIPPLTNELVMLVKDTSLLAVLGVTSTTLEIMKFARDGVSNTANATPLIVAGLVYLALTIPLTRLAGLLERRWKRAR